MQFASSLACVPFAAHACINLTMLTISPCLTCIMTSLIIWPTELLNSSLKYTPHSSSR